MANENKEIRVTEISADITLIVCKAEKFPEGIKDAYTNLGKIISWEGRKCYGLSYCTGVIEYYAGVTEEHSGEGAEKGHLTKTIHKGKYLEMTVKNWQQNVPEIKVCFDTMMARADVAKPAVAVEYYRGDDVDLLVSCA